MHVSARIGKDRFQFFRRHHVVGDDLPENALRQFAHLRFGGLRADQFILACRACAIAGNVLGRKGDLIRARLVRFDGRFHGDLRFAVHRILGIDLRKIRDRLAHIGGAVDHAVQHRRFGIGKQRNRPVDLRRVAGGIHRLHGDALLPCRVPIRFLDPRHLDRRKILCKICRVRFCAVQRIQRTVRALFDHRRRRVHNRQQNEILRAVHGDRNRVDADRIRNERFRENDLRAVVHKLRRNRLVRRFDRNRFDAGNDEVAFDVRRVAALVGHPHRDLLHVHPCFIRLADKRKRQIRFVRCARYQHFRRQRIARTDPDRRFLSRRRNGVRNDEFRFLDLSVFQLQPHRIGSDMVHHLIRRKLFRLRRDAVQKERVRAGRRRSGFQRDLVSDRADMQCGSDGIAVAGGIRQQNRDVEIAGPVKIERLRKSDADDAFVTHPRHEFIRRDRRSVRNRLLPRRGGRRDRIAYPDKNRRRDPIVHDLDHMVSRRQRPVGFRISVPRPRDRFHGGKRIAELHGDDGLQSCIMNTNQRDRRTQYGGDTDPYDLCSSVRFHSFLRDRAAFGGRHLCQYSTTRSKNKVVASRYNL